MILSNILSQINRYFRPTIVKGKNNKVTISTKKKSNFVIRVYGDNNEISVGTNCRLHNTSIFIAGNNNHLILEDVAKFDGPSKITLGGNATLRIGSNSGIRGVEFYVKDGKVEVGKNCMFSYGIIIRNNDAHKVLDKDGNVTNLPKDIIIGDHVWMCQNSAIIKGVNIGNDSIIGFGSVVTKGCPGNCVLAGNPAKVVKENINWQNK